MRDTSSETTSLLAFQFDQNGKPVMVTCFVDDKDKFALLCIARIQIERLLGEAQAIKMEDFTPPRKTAA